MSYPPFSRDEAEEEGDGDEGAGRRRMTSEKSVLRSLLAMPLMLVSSPSLDFLGTRRLRLGAGARGGGEGRTQEGVGDQVWVGGRGNGNGGGGGRGRAGGEGV